MDTKAGIVLGFAGAITALSTRPTGPLSATGLAAAVSAGLLALMSFWPRRFWSTDLNRLRAKYLAAEPAFARVSLVDSQIVMAERTNVTLTWEGPVPEARDGSARGGRAAVGTRRHARVTWEVTVDEDHEEQTVREPSGPTEEPPPFMPDPDLIAHFERGGKPSDAEVREMADRVRARSARERED